MAVTFLGGFNNVRTGTTDPWTFDITLPAGTPRGFAIGISHGVSQTDHVVSVSVGGVALSEIIRRTDAATELGASEFWFVGSGVSGLSGTVTVSIDLASATTDDLLANVWVLGGNADLEVIDSDGLSGDQANPTVTLQKAGRTGFCMAQMYGGGAAPGGTLATGNSGAGTADHGAFYSQGCYETTIDSADHTIGWSTLASDDLAFVAIAVAEVSGVSGSGTPTLGVVTASAAGTVAVAGSGSPALGTLTSSADGDVFVVGSGAALLGAVTASGTGTVGASEITGTGAMTLASLTLAGAGTAPVVGSGNPTLGALSGGGTGTAPAAGTGAPTLAAPTGTGAGTALVQGTCAVTLSLTGSGTGVAPVVGVGAPSLATITASGTVGSPPIEGSGTPSFPEVTGSGAGLVLVQGTSLLSLGLQVAGAGSVEVRGTGGPVLCTLTMSATTAEPPAVRQSPEIILSRFGIY